MNIFTKKYEQLATHMQKDLRDLVGRCFLDKVKTSDTGGTSTVQNNTFNTALNNDIQNTTANSSETDSNENSSTSTFPTIQQNVNVNTLQQNSSNNVPDSNIPQDTNVIISIVHTRINVMEDTVTSPENTTSIGIIPILNSEINIMGDNTSTPGNSTSVQHPTPNIVTQISPTTALPIPRKTKTITISKNAKPSKTKTKNQTTQPKNNITMPQNRIIGQNRKRAKQPYAPYEMIITLRDRVKCTISRETFFSSSEQPRIGRGQNITPICTIRELEELLSDEVDLYINHLNNKIKICKKYVKK